MDMTASNNELQVIEQELFGKGFVSSQRATKLLQRLLEVRAEQRNKPSN